jgi:hypothetical protein
MATHKPKPLVADKTPAPAAVLQAHASDTAPVIYFDGAVAYGLNGQTARIELATTCSLPVAVNGKVEPRQRVMITCHLRGSLDAMAQLADTIEKCLTMAQLPTPADEAPKRAEEKLQ